MREQTVVGFVDAVDASRRETSPASGRRALWERLPAALPRRSFVVAGVLLLALGAVLAMLAGTDTALARRDPLAVNGVLGAAAMTVALAASWMCGVRWRLVCDAFAFRLAIAVPLLFAASAAVAGSVELLSPAVAGSALSAGARTGAAVAGAAVLALAFRRSVIDELFVPLRFVAKVVALAAMVVIVAVSSIGMVPDVIVRVAPGLTWGLLGGAFVLRGVRSRRPLFAWVGLSLVALAYGELGAASADDAASVWATSAGIFGACAAMLVLIGVGHELRLAFAEELQRVFALQVAAEHQRWHRTVEDLEIEARRHDQRAALTTIQCAIERLAADHRSGSTDSSATMVQAIKTEIARLRRSLEGREAGAALATLDLRDQIAPLVTCARATGAEVHLDVDAGLAVVADPDALAEVAQNLIDNALAHGGSGCVRVTAQRTEPGVELVVEDDGTGVPRQLRQLVFEPGVSSKGELHSGIGLYRARRLMRSMGGDLVLGEGARGARFVASFPGNRRTD